MTYTTPKRAGSGRAAGIVLGVAMLAGLGVAGFAIYKTLTAAPSMESARGAANPAGVGESGGAGVADSARLEELLTSVQAYATDGNHVAAEAILTQAIGEYPEDQDLRVAMGELLNGQHRTEEAYEQYLAALAIGPRDAELEYRSGMMAVQLAKHQRAVEHFAAARTANPTVPQYALMLANEQLEVGEIIAGRATLLQVTVLDPNEPLAWGALAKIGLRRNENTIALNHARRAITLAPDQPVYRLYEARALKRLGEAEEALLVLTALPEPTQHIPEFLRTIGECFGLLGRPEEAAKRFERAFEATSNPAIAFETALWHDRAGDDANAILWARKAQQLGYSRAGDWLATADGEG